MNKYFIVEISASNPLTGIGHNQQNTQQNRQEYAAAQPELPEKDFNWVILARNG
jgi:t-SNARE complex subunit (syntaxin)